MNFGQIMQPCKQTYSSKPGFFFLNSILKSQLQFLLEILQSDFPPKSCGTDTFLQEASQYWQSVCCGVLLEDLFSALSLCGEAGDGPHLDLHAGVELFPSHVPNSMTGCGYSAVL